MNIGTIRGRQLGSGLLEFAIAAIVLAILGWFLLDGVGGVQEKAEKKTFEMTVANLEAGLRYEASSRLARGVANPATTLLSGNPMRWLASRPDNYLGEYPGQLADRKRVGVWYFDQSGGELVYVPKRRDNFRTSGDRAEIRLQAQLAPGSSTVIKLAPVRPYTW